MHSWSDGCLWSLDLFLCAHGIRRTLVEYSALYLPRMTHTWLVCEAVPLWPCCHTAVQHRCTRAGADGAYIPHSGPPTTHTVIDDWWGAGIIAHTLLLHMFLTRWRGLESVGVCLVECGHWQQMYSVDTVFTYFWQEILNDKKCLYSNPPFYSKLIVELWPIHLTLQIIMWQWHK